MSEKTKNKQDGEKPDLSDYKSEDKEELANTKIEYTEVKRKEPSDVED